MVEDSGAVNRRVFLVGCSRSGTTLLQVLIASHPKIHSFPETSFFINGIGIRHRPLAWIGLAPRARFAIENFLRVFQREDLFNMIPKAKYLLLKNSIHCFVSILDSLTLEEGKEIWIEKSPMHLHYIPFIKKYVPRCQFIHLIRDGRDVVASIYDRALNFPKKFARQRNLNFAIQRWNRALDVHRQYWGEVGHTFALYEQLVHAPEVVLTRICDHLGVTYDYCMTEVSPARARRYISPDWQSVANALKPPQPMPSKFKRLFDEETRQWISRSLRLREFESFKGQIIDL